MLFEITSSLLVGGFVGYSWLVNNGSTDEGKRIIRICDNAGLSVKGESMRILRRSRRSWGVEYAFKIPLGRSLADYERNLDAIRDGLNAKGTFDMRTLLEALRRRDKDVLRRTKTRKEVELDYDGVLRVRVYDKGLPEQFGFASEIFEKLSGWQVAIGVDRAGKLIKHDFDRHAHLIVAGMTDYGKSSFTNSVITTLVARKTKNVSMYLIDLKGGLEYSRYRNLEQVRGFAKTPDEALEILTEVQRHMNDLIERLLTLGYSDVKKAKIKERHFVIIDEAADISDNKECQAIIKDIARRGRAVGYRLVYTTQYPTNETLSPQVRQNASARLCFRLNTEVASRAVLDEGGAEKLPIGLPGRAIYRTDRKQIVQTPYVSDEFIEETLNLNVTIKGRKDGDDNAFRNRKDSKGTTTRKYTLELEDVGIS